jgi:hypothetical protein
MAIFVIGADLSTSWWDVKAAIAGVAARGVAACGVAARGVAACGVARRGHVALDPLASEVLQMPAVSSFATHDARGEGRRR